MGRSELTCLEREFLKGGYTYDRDIDEINADIIGSMFRSDFINSWKRASEAAFDSKSMLLNSIIEKSMSDKDLAEDIETAIDLYADSQRTLGFREGINIALNFIIQGMRFPTSNG